MNNALKSPPPSVGEGKGGGKSRDLYVMRARNLRQNHTEVEKWLWYWLRRKNIRGARFRRQAPIGRYIVDFACYDPKIVIELDGDQHAEQQNYDKKRDAWLKNQGFCVLRFWNNEVTENMPGVLETIWNQINALNNTSTPLPNPPPQGGRE